MADAIAGLMRSLGHAEYAAVGHDRGVGVAHRLALDHDVTRLVVLDGIPIAEALERCDARFAASWWHWFFFAQTNKPAEDWIARDPLAWYRGDPDAMGAENHADWLRAVTDPAVIRVDGGRVPRRRARRSRSRGVRPRRGPSRDVPDAVRLVRARRHGGALRRPLAIWRDWVDAPCRVRGSSRATTWPRRPRSNSRTC